jgi:hypothetical protein
MFLRFVYVVFVGIIVAAFIGVGVAAFYPEPQRPDAPLSVKYSQNVQISDLAALNTIRAEQAQYETELKAYMAAEQVYGRNVSIITLLAAVAVLATSLTVLKNVSIFADGTLLGGVVTLGYSIVCGFTIQDNRLRFVLLSASLLITLILGYVKFLQPGQKGRSQSGHRSAHRPARVAEQA